MKEKGIKILFSIFLFVSILMPFSVSAAEQTQIVPTWNWGSQYANQFTVTNFCEGSGTSVSCELRFTANNSYYGYLSFDGYNGTTKWIDYKNVWIADGYGAYRYSLYQNGVIQINKINIEGGFLKSSMDNLDLQDIIDLLTAIETDTTSIDNQFNTELQRLQTIINNQIVQNGYLEKLTKLRQYNYPIESFNLIYSCFAFNDIYDFHNLYYWTYPIFDVKANNNIFRYWFTNNRDYWLICFVDHNVFNDSSFLNYLQFPSGITISDYQQLMQVSAVYSSSVYYTGWIVKMKLHFSGTSNSYFVSALQDFKFIPIYLNETSNKLLTLDFALQFGLSNQLLDDLHIIAQGTQQSQQAGSDLDDATSDMQSDFNSYYSIENSANSDFNSALNGINFNDQIAGNQSFLDSASFVKTVFSSMMQIPILSTFVIILCIVLMARIFL